MTVKNVNKHNKNKEKLTHKQMQLLSRRTCMYALKASGLFFPLKYSNHKYVHVLMLLSSRFTQRTEIWISFLPIGMTHMYYVHVCVHWKTCGSITWQKPTRRVQIIIAWKYKSSSGSYKILNSIFQITSEDKQTEYICVSANGALV